MAKNNKKWTSSDDERLLKFSEAGTPVPVIAISLGRTQSAVEGRLAILEKQTVISKADNIEE
jgi:hypothetical protein